MKHIYFAFLVCTIVTLSGCKTQTANMTPLDPYVNVNMDYVRANCEPVESYQFPVFGVYTLPARVKSCAGVADMFLVAWPGENGDVEQTIAKLLTLLYVKSNNERQDPDLTATFVKYSSTEDGSMHASFYELNEIKISVPALQEDTTP
jgi:hypothetical protein